MVDVGGSDQADREPGWLAAQNADGAAILVAALAPRLPRLAGRAQYMVDISKGDIARCSAMRDKRSEGFVEKSLCATKQCQKNVNLNLQRGGEHLRLANHARHLTMHGFVQSCGQLDAGCRDKSLQTSAYRWLEKHASFLKIRLTRVIAAANMREYMQKMPELLDERRANVLREHPLGLRKKSP